MLAANSSVWCSVSVMFTNSFYVFASNSSIMALHHARLSISASLMPNRCNQPSDRWP